MGRKPVIKSLALKGFRSVAAERIDFDNPTLLIGENGSGKSNIVDAFAFLAEAMASPLESVFERRGSITSLLHRHSTSNVLGMAVDLGQIAHDIVEGHYAFEVTCLTDRGFEVSQERCRIVTADGERHWFERNSAGFDSDMAGLKPFLDPASLSLPAVGGHAQFTPVLRTLSSMRSYSIEPSRVRKMQVHNGGLSLGGDGRNAAVVLQEIQKRAPESIQDISEFLTVILRHPTHVKVLVQDEEPSLQFTEDLPDGQSATFGSSAMSDGALRMLVLLAAVFQVPTPSLLAIEEPETSLHPGALGVVLDLIELASSRAQVVVTTHSSELLDAKWIQDHHLRVVSWEGGATRVFRLSEGSGRVLQQHLMGAGEMLRSNVLTTERRVPHPSIEIFDEVG